MTAHAALIAEKLQGAHERRQRGEDKDMGKDEGVWAEAARQIEQALTMVRENVERGLPDEDAPQSNAVTAERVVELERRLADACADRDRLQTLADKTALAAADRALGPDAGERVVELERQLAEGVEHRNALERDVESARRAAERGSVYWSCDRCNADEHKCPGCGASLNHWRAVCDECRERADAEDVPLAHQADAAQAIAELEQQRDTWRERSNRQTERTAELELLLRTAYVVREVPWSDVAAGMMTIARDGTAWMIEQVLDGDVPISFRLRNGEKTFTKTPNDLGETVRVLVPYVTPEQAEKTVADGLGAVRA